MTIVVPAHNEQECIVESVRSLLALRYQKFDVIVVSDGSTDATVEVLRSAFDLEIFPRVYVPSIPTMPVRKVFRSRTDARLTVVEKANGGKADALNCGINLADRELICAIDADAILDQDALLLACRPFLEEPDEVVATGGIVRIANGCRIESGHVEQVALPKSRLAAIQVVEYLRAFLTARSGVEPRQCSADRQRGVRHLPPRRAARPRRLPPRDGRRGRGAGRPHPPPLPRAGREVQGVLRARPGGWTEAPETLKVLRRQRVRWARGLFEILTMHGRITARPATAPSAWPRCRRR